MNVNRLFIAGMVVLLLVLVVFQVKIPQNYSWKASFSHYSSQPFGAMVMDSVMEASAPAGYSVTGKSLSQLRRDTADCSIIIAAGSVNLTMLDCQAIEALLDRGVNILLATADDYNISNPDSLLYCRDIDLYYNGYYGYQNIEESLKSIIKDTNKEEETSLLWTGAAPPRKQDEFSSNSFLSAGSIIPVGGNRFVYDDEGNRVAIHPYRDLQTTELITRRRLAKFYPEGYEDENTSEILSAAVVAKRESQRGKLIVVSNPLWFTNYGFLNHDMRTLAMRLISMLGNKPIVRLDPTMTEGRETTDSQSPLRYMLHNPSLRWALYLTLLAVLLIFIFGARRRQRVIPVVKAPENMALKFVKQMGLYYFSRHDNADLIDKRYDLFKAQLRRNLLIDLDDDDLDDAIAQLSQVTAIDRHELAERIDYIKRVVELNRNEQNVSDDVMRYCIDTMDVIARDIELSYK